MQFIQSLIRQGFSVFNVDDKKRPCNKAGFMLKEWQTLSAEDVRAHHNYESTLWGIRMGEHANGRRIMSLDFDCCGKPVAGVRIGCEYTKERLEAWRALGCQDGMYSSSTAGNYNVLVDYTHSPTLIHAIGGRGKYTRPKTDLEVLIGSGCQQVIPPSCTVCKISGKAERARAFLNDNPLLVLDEGSPQMQFIVDLITPPIASKTTIKVIKVPQARLVEDSDDTPDKDSWLKLLFDVIGNDVDSRGVNVVDWDTWFKIAGILKSNKYSKEVFMRYSAISPNCNSSTASQLWDGIKQDKMDIHGLQNVAKEINPDGYDAWLQQGRMRKCDIVIPVRNTAYKKMFTTGLIADIFAEVCGTSWIYSNGSLYHYNGVFWEREHDKRMMGLHNYIDTQFQVAMEIYAKHHIARMRETVEKAVSQTHALTDAGLDVSPEQKKALSDARKNEEFVEHFYTEVQCLRKIGNRKQLVEDILNKIAKNVKFDTDPMLFAFTNCIFDLNTGGKVPPNPEQMVSKTCGYAYDDEYDLKTHRAEIDELYAKIFPEKAMLDFNLTALSTGLCGEQIEKLFVMTGVGGNGKSLQVALTEWALGEYAYVLPSEVLLNPIKLGANPEVANLNGVRFCTVSEPDSGRKIKTSVVKELTGCKTIAVRQHYSTDCECRLNMTLCMDANELPHLDKVDIAMQRRVEVIPFVSRFVDADVLDAMGPEAENVFLGNPLYKTDAWLEGARQAWFHILLDSFKVFVENGKQMAPAPASSKKETAGWFATSDDVYTWFQDVFVKDAASIIPLSEVYELFAVSEYFQNMNKADKRRFNRKGFLEKIESNMFLRHDVKLRAATYAGKQLRADSICGWRKRIEEGGDDKDY